MKLNRPLFAAISLLIIGLSPATAEVKEACNAISKSVSGESELASASSWANLSGSKNSIKNLSSSMLNSAQEKLSSLTPPPELCSGTCTATVPPQMEFSWVPNKYLEQYGDLDKCTEKLKETTATPLNYPNLTFSKLDDLATWFAEFSQGKGALGSDLYSRCDGSCSPQYFADITNSSTGFLVNVNVICGHARDKDDDQYKLTSSYAWNCIEASGAN